MGLPLGRAAWAFDGRGRVVVDRPDRLERLPIQMLACGSSYFGIADALLRGFSGRDYARMLGEFDGPAFPKGQARSVWIREGGALECATDGPADSLTAVLDLGEVSLRRARAGLSVETAVFVPAGLPCECWEVRVEADRPRTVDVALVLPLFAGSRAYVEYHRDVVRLYHKPSVADGVLTVANGLEWIEGRTGRSDVRYTAAAAGRGGRAPDRVWSDREDFLGPRQRWDRPEALEADRPPRIEGLGRELVAAFEFRGLAVGPGAPAVLALAAGVGAEAGEAGRIAALADPAAAAAARAEVGRFWDELAGRVTISTGDADLDAAWNRWWLHQSMIRHWFGNTGHPQFDYGSDFSGWREIWQDLMATAPLDPEEARRKARYVLTGIRPDGTNATRFFTRTGRFGFDEAHEPWCDHPYWTLPAVEMIANETGDAGFYLEDGIGYDRDENLRGTVVEHLLVQAFGMVRDRGPRGLLRHRRAGWNDAIDQLSGGENVVFSLGLARNLRTLARIVEGMGEVAFLDGGERRREAGADLARRLRGTADEVVALARRHAWNGEYFHGYLRADGRAIEEAGESRIHLMPQTWALYADAVSGAEVDRLIAAVFRLLADPLGGLKLNAPPYTRFDPEIGRITGFAPGTKENNAVFCHANLYFVHALLLRRRAEEAWRVLRGISPLGRDRASTAGPHLPEYWISSDHPHLAGRAEYPLLTGTGPWTRLMIPRWFFGVRGVVDGLLVDPCLPDDPSFRDATVRIPFRGGRYAVRIRSAAGVSAGRVRAARLDGRPVEPEDGRLLLRGPHAGPHEVEVEVGG